MSTGIHFYLGEPDKKIQHFVCAHKDNMKSLSIDLESCGVTLYLRRAQAIEIKDFPDKMIEEWSENEVSQVTA
jgi:hypothetical protein